MVAISPSLLVALMVVTLAYSTPIPRTQLYSGPDNEPEPAVASKRQGDLRPAGTIGLNVFTSPLGGVYSGIGSINPYSYGAGSIGTAYGVNQLNTPGVLGAGGYYGAAGGGLGGLGLGGLGGGALGPAGIGGFGGGLGGFGSGVGGLGGINGFGGGLGGLGGIGGFGGGLGGVGGYPYGGGLGGGIGLGGGGLYSEGDSRGERIRRKFLKALEKLNKRTNQSVQSAVLQTFLTPYGGIGQGGYGGFGGGIVG